MKSLSAASEHQSSCKRLIAHYLSHALEDWTWLECANFLISPLARCSIHAKHTICIGRPHDQTIKQTFTKSIVDKCIWLKSKYLACAKRVMYCPEVNVIVASTTAVILNEQRFCRNFKSLLIVINEIDNLMSPSPPCWNSYRSTTYRPILYLREMDDIVLLLHYAPAEDRKLHQVFAAP